MADFLNPVPYLEDLAHVFQDGAGKAEGLTIDPVLCRAFAEGLGDVAEKVDRLVTFVAAEGCVRSIDAPPERRRTPVERRNLARLSAPLDPARRVLSFPAGPARSIAITEGGTAA